MANLLRSSSIFLILIILTYISPLMTAHDEAPQALLRASSDDGQLPGHPDANQGDIQQIQGASSSFLQGRKLRIHGVYMKKARRVLPRGGTTGTTTSSSSAFRTMNVSSFSAMASFICSCVLLRAFH